MGSPNEPGPPRTGDGPGSTNGAHEAGPANGAGSSGDVPPWQRGAATRPRQPEGPRAGAAAGHQGGGSPSADARLNRFISGGPANGPAQASPPRESTPPREAGPAREPAPARESTPARDSVPTRESAPTKTDAVPPNRNEPARSEAYASELPDLSGVAPRGPRKPTAERTAAEPSSRPSSPATRASAASRSQGPVRASMQIRRFDPWSVLKVSLVLSVALFFVWMIAVAFLYLVLGGMGVWTKLNSNVGDLLTSASGSGGELVSSGTIFGGAALIGLVNIVLLTAMATCGAFIYNLTTDLVGGVEVTLADRD
ncbi:DUF3566 domain-containing protein [Mycobacterium sp. AT1]|uniref:DUF3566 domain-containing protein n=1 Tax=Mycobacterium sp. AT1 TaxID=1961706 RepID=UPI0009AEAF01|nr:DUF3566 domain-containing protein [Mycobacterium sp. AT1]OPX11844.1 hypothetical protein B1790_06735 [Mycobacterium sp. AT1]